MFQRTRRNQHTRNGAVAVAALLLGATACATDQQAPPKATGKAASKSATPKATAKSTGSKPKAGPKAEASASAEAEAAKKPHSFTLAAAGDVLPHDSIIRQAAADAGGEGYDFRKMFAGLKPVISKADLALCHMETVYGEDGNYSGYPAFKSPPQVAAALADTGYDGCSTASNHTLDDGADGIERTLGALDKAGVKHAGSARTEKEAHTPTMLSAGGAKVAHIAATYGTNGYPLPKGRPWAVNMLDKDKVIADARAARKAGADIVVFSPHWGTEWQDEPDAKQLRLAKELTASRTGGRPDIDLIIGTHAHVPQAYEKVNGTWVVYGMGDQIAGAMINYSGAQDTRGNQSTIGRFTFAPPKRPAARWEVSRADFVPLYFDPNAGRARNLDEAEYRDAYAEMRDRVRGVVLSRGAGKQGLAAAK